MPTILHGQGDDVRGKFAVLIGDLYIFDIGVHPGNGGNPGFNSYDLDSRLRMVFYPAVIGWIAMGTWIASLRIRTHLLTEKLEELEDEQNS